MDIFDIVGPIMIGPSSSHTAGASRIGQIAYRLLNEQPKRAEIIFHGSFAHTYRGHGTDRAVVAGVLGMTQDDERIRDAFTIAKNTGLRYNIETADLGDDVHPNTVQITLTGQSGQRISVRGASIGGGNIMVTAVNGMDVQFTGQRSTLIVMAPDEPGVIAHIANVFNFRNINICTLKFSRDRPGGNSVLAIEADEDLPEDIGPELEQQPQISQCILISKLE